MKQLLVAFDFSKNALKTLDYALMVANKIGAELNIVWVDASNTPDNVINIDHELRIETKKLFDEIIPAYEPKLHNGKINLILRKGKVYSEVAMAAKMIGADLIFSGTHGVSGFEQYWIGSNAYRIVAHAPCPVITIRGDYEIKKEIQRILLPLDSTPETRNKLPLAAKLAESFGAEVHLQLLYNSPVKVVRMRMKTYANEAVKCLSEKNIKYVLKESEADNLVRTILDYADSSNADMILIMTEQGGTSGNVFLGPYAQQLINNALIPVLSLQSGNQ